MREFISTMAVRAAGSDLIKNLIRDLKSLRALWNWLYMGLYFWVCVYATLKHPNTIPTVIKVTGGVVSIIFSGYIFSKSYEKRHDLDRYR